MIYPSKRNLHLVRGFSSHGLWDGGWNCTCKLGVMPRFICCQQQRISGARVDHNHQRIHRLAVGETTKKVSRKQHVQGDMIGMLMGYNHRLIGYLCGTNLIGYLGYNGEIWHAKDGLDTFEPSTSRNEHAAWWVCFSRKNPLQWNPKFLLTLLVSRKSFEYLSTCMWLENSQ